MTDEDRRFVRVVCSGDAWSIGFYWIVERRSLEAWRSRVLLGMLADALEAGT